MVVASVRGPLGRYQCHSRVPPQLRGVLTVLERLRSSARRRPIGANRVIFVPTAGFQPLVFVGVCANSF